MSSSLVPSSRWQQCRIRRFYSTGPPEKPKPQAQRAPRASDYGGIEIAPTPQHLRGIKLNRKYIIPVFSPNTSALSVSEFRPGFSRRLAERRVAEMKMEANANMADAPWTDMVAGPEQRPDSGKKDGEKSAGPSSQRRPSAQTRSPDNPVRNQLPPRPRAERQPRPPGQPKPDLMQTTRRGSGSAPNRRRRRPREQSDEDLDFDESDADDIDSDEIHATPMRMRRPDAPLAPPKPRLPPPLTMLGIQIDVDRGLQGLHEHLGGDYARHFSPETWSLARAQPLAATDYARLALGMNRSVGIEEKRAGVQMVKKLVDKAAQVTAAP